MTREEAILWRELRGNRLEGHHFRRQQVIDGFVVDFFCNPAGVVIELDGGVHSDPDQARYDSERDAFLSGRGLRIIRFRNDELRHDLDAVLARIASVCREAT
jgi:very-short-patch-repair endonuclease